MELYYGKKVFEIALISPFIETRYIFMYVRRARDKGKYHRNGMSTIRQSPTLDRHLTLQACN